MDKRETDARLREIYRRNAPAVNTSAFSARLHQEISPKKRARQTHWPSRRLVLALASLVLIAGVTWGVAEAITHLGRHQVVLVITDETTEGQTTSSSKVAVPAGALEYGQTALVDKVEVTVTVAPVLAPADWQGPVVAPGYKRLASQVIVQNTGSASWTYRPSALLLEDTQGKRYQREASEYLPTMPLDPGGTITEAVTWVVPEDVTPRAVVFQAPQSGSKEQVWAGSTITKGPGYPVLSNLPALEPQQVSSVDFLVYLTGQLTPERVLQANTNQTDIQNLLAAYQKVALDASQGYPRGEGYLDLVFHLLGGGTVNVSVMDDGHCTVADKREAQDAPSVNPPAGFGWAPDLATTARAILDNTPPAPSSSTQTPTTAGTSATLTATTYGPPTT